MVTFGKVKTGQVFTPPDLVKIILDYAGYDGAGILRRHVIDNSCGDGAFLTEIVRRYCKRFLEKKSDAAALRTALETYVHGIEIERETFERCLERLAAVASEFGLTNVKWDVRCGDALKISDYDGKMDFVVGNPPYVRVHDLSDYEAAKRYKFAKKGMTDLFIVFFEIGFKMLAREGVMCLITPSSWLTSNAGTVLRQYVRAARNMSGLIDLGHYQAFDATTYTLISRFRKGERFDEAEYFTFDGKTHFVGALPLDDIEIDGRFYLATRNQLAALRKIFRHGGEKKAVVKNGFATLADKVFVGDFKFDGCVIDVVKGSSGRWTRCVFPYNENAQPYGIETIRERFPAVYEHLSAHKAILQHRDAESAQWHLFGRSQAIKDVYSEKFAVNSIIRDIPSIKLNRVRAGQGVYSGLYILTAEPENVIKNILLSDEFVEYVKTLKHYKSGGYYTFSSKEIETFINYKLTDRNE